MFESLFLSAKKAVLRSSLPPSHSLESVSQLLKFCHWIRSGGLLSTPEFPSRFALYEYIQSSIIGDQAIDYLEFGVYKGESIGKWAVLNRQPESRFYGFDTFEGLPEAWKQGEYTIPASYFSTDGKVPDLADPRVHFVKGLFQDTLGAFARQFAPGNKLVLHLDADLYASTLYVLATLDGFIKPGTVLMFDEFLGATHEFRAFTDYCASFRKKLKPLGYSGQFYHQVAFIAL